MNQYKKAFTIIEVVLVLAVAGLIFLVVFAAIPRLQSSRRDNQRKRDAESMVALVVEYESNTGTRLANATFNDALAAGAQTGAFSTGYYASANFSDPSGGEYAYDATPDDAGQVRYVLNYRCDPDNSIADGNQTDFWTPSTGDFVVRIGLERGTYCVDVAS